MADTLPEVLPGVHSQLSREASEPLQARHRFTQTFAVGTRPRGLRPGMDPRRAPTTGREGVLSILGMPVPAWRSPTNRRLLAAGAAIGPDDLDHGLPVASKGPGEGRFTGAGALGPQAFTSPRPC